MKKKYLLFFVFIVSISLTVFAQVDIKKSNEVRIIKGKEYYIHIVEKGHTLYSLARVYEIPMKEIIFENPTAKDHLYIGQELKIPIKSRDVDVEQSLRSNVDEFFYHVSKRGETLRDIARIYSITKRDLDKVNPNLYDPLKLGQYVKIPVSAKKIGLRSEKFLGKKKTVVLNSSEKLSRLHADEHIVKAGENLYRIALNYQLRIEELKAANPGLTETLTIGQRIKIPLKKKESNFIFHKVKRKGKLSRIARNYNVSIQVLKENNPRVGDRTKVGDIIKIPLYLDSEVEEAIIPENKVVIKETVGENASNQDSIRCMNCVGHSNDTYKVALMIPLFLDDIQNLELDEETDIESYLDKRPFRFLQYYYGTMMAVDSLNVLGGNFKLTVYDADSSNIARMIKILNDPSLQEQDLIIAPIYYRKSFELVERFAKIFEIPIVNPLSNRSEIIQDNPFIFKCKPTTDYQHLQVRDLVATYFRNAKIFFVKHKQTLEEREFPLYISEIQDLIDTGYYISNDDIYDLIIKKSLADTSTVKVSREFVATLDTLTGFTTEVDSLFIEDDLVKNITIEGHKILTDSIEFNLYDSTYIKNTIVPFYYATDSIYGFENQASIYRDNVVFVFTDDNVFALDLMTKLNVERDTFPTTVVGLPNWREFKNMDNEILSNLKVHVLSSAFVNYQDRNTNHFIYHFRKRYLTEPLDYAFKGFDISWYFLNALKNFGNNFENCLPYYSPWYIQTEMKFERTRAGEGFENRFWKILKYDNYRLSEVPVHPPESSVTKDPQ